MTLWPAGPASIGIRPHPGCGLATVRSLAGFSCPHGCTHGSMPTAQRVSRSPPKQPARGETLDPRLDVGHIVGRRLDDDELRDRLGLRRHASLDRADFDAHNVRRDRHGVCAAMERSVVGGRREMTWLGDGGVALQWAGPVEVVARRARRLVAGLAGSVAGRCRRVTVRCGTGASSRGPRARRCGSATRTARRGRRSPSRA